MRERASDEGSEFEHQSNPRQSKQSLLTSLLPRPSIFGWSVLLHVARTTREEPMVLLLCIVIARRCAFSIIMLGGSKARRAWLNP